ncbi:hypothetical protein N7U49_40070 [Streptomyces sp. AD2-2]|nr:hypothetical protein N7U49_40070 [Streptomyces sp. AD2-2]
MPTGWSRCRTSSSTRPSSPSTPALGAAGQLHVNQGWLVTHFARTLPFP